MWLLEGLIHSLHDLCPELIEKSSAQCKPFKKIAFIDLCKVLKIALTSLGTTQVHFHPAATARRDVKQSRRRRTPVTIF